MNKTNQVEKFPLKQIMIDDRLQARVSVNEQTVDSYCEAAADGWPFPPITLMLVDGRYLLIDGRHRYQTARKLGHDSIEAVVSEGTMQDAIRAACSSNADHGLPRTNADKRRAIELALEEFPALSNREIAKICKVSHTSVNTFRVNNLRSSLMDDDSDHDEWMETSDDKYHPLHWTEEIGDACYQFQHDDTNELSFMLIFQADRLSYSDGSGADWQWKKEIFRSSNSGYYAVAMQFLDEGQQVLEIMRPVDPKNIKTVVRMFTGKLTDRRATLYTGSPFVISEMLNLFEIPDQDAYSQQLELITNRLAKV